MDPNQVSLAHFGQRLWQAMVEEQITNMLVFRHIRYDLHHLRSTTTIDLFCFCFCFLLENNKGDHHHNLTWQGMTCPPKSFVEIDCLKHVYQCLSDHGFVSALFPFSSSFLLFFFSSFRFSLFHFPSVFDPIIAYLC